MRLALQALDKLWARLSGVDDKAELLRLLREAIPALVNQYGSIAAVAANEWYDTVRADTLSGVDGFHASLRDVDGMPVRAIRDSIGWMAAESWKQPGHSMDLDLMANLLRGGVDRWVRFYGQQALRVNTFRDPKADRFAIVPVGKTCAFCCMLASRGFTYTSEENANNSRHAGCDCQVVPGWNTKKVREAVITGYNPNTYYDMYQKAKAKLDKISQAEAKGQQLDDDVSVSLRRDMGGWWESLADEKNKDMRPFGYRKNMTLGSYLKKHAGYENADSDVTQRALLGLMRRMSPNNLADGVHVGKKAVADSSMKLHDWEDYRSSLATRFITASNRSWGFPPKKPAPVPEDWPNDIPKPTIRAWNHILYGYVDKDGKYGGGHLNSYGWIEDNGKNTVFPKNWDENDVEEAIINVLKNGESRGSSSIIGTYNGVNIQVVRSSGHVITAFPVRRQ